MTMNSQPRVVLIDDDAAWLEALAEYLRENGFKVETANDGAAGLGLLEGDGFALALIDVHMPGMDGLEVLRRLRQRRPDFPAILVSNDDAPALADEARAAGASGFVAKTSSPRLLLQAVRQALPRSPAPRRDELPSWERLLPGPDRNQPALSGSGCSGVGQN